MSDNTPNGQNNWRHEITQPFIDLFHTSRALFGVNLSFFIEGVCYFGMASLLVLYFSESIGLGDIKGGQMTGILTAGITLAMLVLGATVDLIGVRRSLLLGFLLLLLGRVFMSLSPALTGTTGWLSSAHVMTMFGVLWIVVGYGIYQPCCYAAVKQFTDARTSAMGYAMLYALMNLGAFLSGLLSPPIRKEHGITGVFWVYAVFTAVSFFIVFFLITNKAAAQATATVETEKRTGSSVGKEKRQSAGEKLRYYLKNFPLTDLRFLFFIFILIPVQTLFAHQWLTLPVYCQRAFTGVVSDRFEFFTNLNPLLIFVLTPMVAALTATKHPYKMMVAGTLVMAAPTFLLALPPNVYCLFAFIFIGTVGEAMWQPRFLQWIADIAPKGMTGIYMGIGQFPWFLTKIVTSLYSGWFLANYCTANAQTGAMRSETMWLVYALIAMVSPIALILASSWMLKGFRDKQE
jgi:MFS family permease